LQRFFFLAVLFVILFLGLVISTLTASQLVSVSGVQTKRDVLIMFLFGAGTLVALAVYDVFAAFGTFRRRRDLQKQVERLESELLDSKHKPPPPATY